MQMNVPAVRGSVVLLALFLAALSSCRYKYLTIYYETENRQPFFAITGSAKDSLRVIWPYAISGSYADLGETPIGDSVIYLAVSVNDQTDTIEYRKFNGKWYADLQGQQLVSAPFKFERSNEFVNIRFFATGNSQCSLTYVPLVKMTPVQGYDLGQQDLCEQNNYCTRLEKDTFVTIEGAKYETFVVASSFSKSDLDTRMKGDKSRPVLYTYIDKKTFLPLLFIGHSIGSQYPYQEVVTKTSATQIRSYKRKDLYLKELDRLLVGQMPAAYDTVKHYLKFADR